MRNYILNYYERQVIKLEEKKDFNRSKKNGTPGFEVQLRKFFRDVQQSRILSEAKKRRFHTKDISRTEKRNIARHKAMIKKLKRGY